MNDFFRLIRALVARLNPFRPKPHGKPRVDGKRVPSGIAFINRNGVRRRDALKALARTGEGDRGTSGDAKAPETACSRWNLWTGKAIFAQITAGAAASPIEPEAAWTPSSVPSVAARGGRLSCSSPPDRRAIMSEQER